MDEVTDNNVQNTRHYKNAQVVTGLQTSCYKSVHTKLSTICILIVCC